MCTGWTSKHYFLPCANCDSLQVPWAGAVRLQCCLMLPEFAQGSSKIHSLQNIVKLLTFKLTILIILSLWAQHKHIKHKRLHSHSTEERCFLSKALCYVRYKAAAVNRFWLILRVKYFHWFSIYSSMSVLARGRISLFRCTNRQPSFCPGTHTGVPQWHRGPEGHTGTDATKEPASF